MRRYNQTEIQDRAKTLFTRLVSCDSLPNAKKIVRAVRLLVLAEEKRRKSLEVKK